MTDKTTKWRIEAEKLLSKIEKLGSLFECAKMSENRTEELANAIQIGFIQFWEYAKDTLFKSKFLNMREFRNSIAHVADSENFWTDSYPKLVSGFQKVLSKKPELEKFADRFSENEKKRRFEKLADEEHFGDQRSRKKTVNALDDAFKNDLSEDDKSEFPPSSEIISKTVNEISDEIKEYIGNHEALSENVQTDILDWSEKVLTDVDIAASANFEKEKEFIQRLNGTDPSVFFDNIDEFESEFKHIDTSDKDFDMRHYKIMLQEDLGKIEKKQKEETKKYQDAYFQAVIKSLAENFNARKAAFEQKLIDEKRKQFLKELYEKIEKFKKIEQVLQPFIDDLGYGYLWDMSNAPFRNLGFDVLAKYASLLKNDKALQEFAEILGKQSATSEEVEKQIMEETVIKSSYHPKPAHRGNVVGFEYSNEISRVLPSEIAVLNNPEIENLFYFRFIEKQLLSYKYSRMHAVRQEETRQKEIEVSKLKDLSGPIIICVDTSGSMQGVPEQTAKLATFALAKIAIKEHRTCFLISFSTGIETLDLSDFKKPNALETLVNFLNKSFNGGTDATPALSECLRQLKTENYNNADVLMISDFVMSSLPAQIVSAIESEKKKGTLFYSLVIGQSANNRAIECFNENITYNPYDVYSRQEFYKKIRQMATEKRSHESDSMVMDMS